MYGLSLLHVSNGEWKTTQFSSFQTLSQELYKINPKEVVLEKSLFQDVKIKEVLQKKYSLNVYFCENNF
jgi:DNA mismatch repair ATPase MutS